MTQRTALVTGNAGFIGGAFFARLIADDWNVTGVDIAEAHHHDGCSIKTDCRDFFGVAKAPYNLLVHAAAVIGSRQDRDDGPMAVWDNLSIDQAAIAWCQRTGTPLLYFSSSAVYSTQSKGPFKEWDIDPDVIDYPDANYGFIKLVGERMCRDLAVSGANVHVVRPFSGYGPGQSLDYPFPSIMQRAANREDPLTVWSATERDFIHVDDLVSACLAMVERDIAGPVNIGTGVPTKMTELARLAYEAVGYHPALKVLGKSVGPDHRFPDVSLMRSFYSPKIALKEGVAQALRVGSPT